MDQQKYRQKAICRSNYLKWKADQNQVLNSKDRRRQLRLKKFSEKETQKLCTQKGAPRKTPHKKIDLEDGTKHAAKIPPYVPARQKKIPKNIKAWIPTGRAFDIQGNLILIN